MSWSPIIPVAAQTTGTPRNAAVSVGMQVKTRVTMPGLLVMLRPYLLPDAPAWLVAHGTVKAMLGGGEHAGMIRLEPGGVFKLGRTATNAAGKPVLQLRLPSPIGIVDQRRKAVPAEFDYGDDWLEITLPAWARALGAPTPAAASGPTVTTRIGDPSGAAPAARPTGNATPPARAAELAAAAAEMARRKAGRG